MNSIKKLNSLFESDNIFITEVEIDIIGSTDFDKDIDSIESKVVMIKWGLELEYRSWGIKDVNIFIPEQDITIILNKIINDDGDIEPFDIIISSNDIEIVKEQIKIPLYPSKLEYYNNKWALIFN